MSLAEIPPGAVERWAKNIPRNCFVNRDGAIVDLCRGKRVLHLGAADAPFHAAKAAKGELLHQKVRLVASQTVAVDLNRQAIECLRAEFGIGDIIVADLFRMNELVPKMDFDVILCCDIIEHVSNVQGLLDVCKSYMMRDALLVVTTINATALKPAVRAIMGREAVHWSHFAYYSYGTLLQVLRASQLVPLCFGTFCYPTVSKTAGLLFKLMARIAPGTADGILVTARRPAI